MRKRLLPLMLALVLCLGLTVPALAAEKTIEVAIPCEYGEAGDFSEGLAWVRKDDGSDYGHVGFINKTGEIVIPCVYDQAHNFSEGLAAVAKGEEWGFIDKTGKEVIPCKYEYATAFSEGLVAVRKDGKWGYIDNTGREIIPCEYVNGREAGFSEGLAGMVKNDKYGFIDKTGKEVIPFVYDKALDFSEGLVGVMKNGKWGYIDQTGKEIIPCKFDKSDIFCDGLARVQQNDKTGFIDKTGAEVIPCKYDGAGDFSDGLAIVIQNDKWGFIDRTGEIVIPFEYDEARHFSEGYAPVKKWIGDALAWGYIDKTGAEVVPCKIDAYDAPDRYVDTSMVSEGMGVVRRYYNGGVIFGYLAFPTVEEETPELAEVTAKVSGWAKELVDSAAANGLIADGLGDDYTVSITRAQFAAVTVKLYEAMSGETAPAAGDSPFTDTTDPAVIQAESLGFVGGKGNGKFDPDSPVTREQAALMLSRVYTKLGGELPTVDATEFTDDDAMSDYARNAIAFMSGKGIVGGVGNNKFDPQGNASIEQALVIALRMFENLK